MISSMTVQLLLSSDTNVEDCPCPYQRLGGPTSVNDQDILLDHHVRFGHANRYSDCYQKLIEVWMHPESRHWL